MRIALPLIVFLAIAFPGSCAAYRTGAESCPALNWTSDERYDLGGSTQKTHCPDADRITLDIDAARRNAGAWTKESVLHPQSIQLAGELAVAGTRFYRTDPTVDPNNPFVVVKATRDISAGHTDMFNPNLINFVIRYVAETELKRLAPRAIPQTR